MSEVKEVTKEAVKIHGNKKKPPNVQGQTGFTETLRKIAATVVIHRVPEITRFLVNVASVASTALLFEHVLRYEKQPPTAHPANCVYSAYFMWLVLCKLYNVGRRTGQLRGFGDNFEPESPDLPLPASIATLIDGLGEFEDHQTKIMIAPFVTPALLGYVSSLSAHFVGLPYLTEDDPNAYDMLQILRGYVQYCYGVDTQRALCWRSFALRSGISISMAAPEDHYRGLLLRETAAAQLLANAGNAINAVNINCAEAMDEVISRSFSYNVVGGNAPAVPQVNVNAFFSAPRRAMVVQVQADLVAAAGFAIAPYGQGNNVGAAPFSQLVGLQISAWLRKNFVVRSLSGNYIGSVSSIVVYSRRGVGCCMSCVAPATSEEMLFGGMWGSGHVILVDALGNLMNLNDAQRNTPPFSTQDLATTRVKLLSASILESRISKKDAHG